MAKIAIVGVEGSGKTVLMAAFGEKYERPDADGYLLSADTRATYDLTHAVIDRCLRRGEWPPATEKGSVTRLDWTLARRKGSSNRKLCGLSFLDYGGEIYRFAFGDRPASETGLYDDEIKALKNHIREADALAVLVNLKDVIDGDGADPRSHEMKWITKSLIDYAAGKCAVRRIALVFSQFDTYRAIVDAAGGLSGAFCTYLGHIEGAYPSLKLLAVSAVDRTVLDAKGRELPAPGFSSRGLEELMKWIARSARRIRVRRFFKRLFLALALIGAAVAALAVWSEVDRRQRAARCVRCAGSGETDCPSCRDGVIPCRTCGGSGRGSSARRVYCAECGGTGKKFCDRAGIYNVWSRHLQACGECVGGVVYTSTGAFPCRKCQGGFRLCEACRGTGNADCPLCDGTGMRTETEETGCPACGGTGRERCRQPGCLSGRLTCKDCGGTGKWRR